MIPGPTQVLECPHCKTPHLQLSLISAGVTVVRVWTDGRTDGPVMQIAPRFTKCSNCQGYFWTDEASIIDQIPYGVSGEKANLLNSPRVLWPTAEEYHDALAKKAYGKDPEKEKYLRIHLWWAINDILTNRLLPSFKSAGIDAIVTDKSRSFYLKYLIENSKKLKKLLHPDSPKDRLMLAELLREEGNFEESLQLLSNEFGDESKLAADKIRELATAHQTDVTELPLI